ncbi:UDP-N-acetylglucosamine 1-carboxyvinyltransferase [Sporanaerobium hydrogeniformans]|uniref:UDP-N-acetylglucosamine 1-carboxyvinyltransferase n=1 Tax=Sporanaerobium hydrogeniformans TaxID=3072179 RepID=A0AC61DEN2_9FIRM|nr:UDP-N-acetylglucosamine 1-carboxyvinyltransferase [Sporanaerobium hydrogeniformans]PHV71092.1 UDP-N-acetylglucosamine 1-carboxyvinyltransferase [Sporanaerobium hydrogeniformans]
MSKYVIHGGKRLEGELRIDGSKNAVLPIIAATLLTGKKTYLYNCPKITDVEIMMEILKQLGCDVKWDNKTLIIDTSTLKSYNISEELVRKMRSSIILLGAIIGRLGKAKISYPGGCPLGARPIDLHLMAFKKMGILVEEKHGFIICESRYLRGAKIHLDFPSVGATENVMLAATLASGTTIIDNAAREPEIVDLQDYLNACGAQITGAGSGTIVIHGVTELHDVTYKVIPDRIMAGTYLVAAAITRGNIILNEVNPTHLRAITSKLEETGCTIIEEKQRIILETPRILKGITLTTEPYPGYPTDMQSQMMALLCTSKETSIIKENLFEARFKPAYELIRMGANISVEGKIAIIRPSKQLTGTNVQAEDLRGGAGLVLAGLCAIGETSVENIHHIKRGYEDIARDLRELGACIEERE